VLSVLPLFLGFMLFRLQGEIMQYEVNEGEDDSCGRKLLNRLRRLQIIYLRSRGGGGMKALVSVSEMSCKK